jgi:hypothetical protein
MILQQIVHPIVTLYYLLLSRLSSNTSSSNLDSVPRHHQQQRHQQQQLWKQEHESEQLQQQWQRQWREQPKWQPPGTGLSGQGFSFARLGSSPQEHNNNNDNNIMHGAAAAGAKQPPDTRENSLDAGSPIPSSPTGLTDTPIFVPTGRGETFEASSILYTTGQRQRQHPEGIPTATPRTTPRLTSTGKPTQAAQHSIEHENNRYEAGMASRKQRILQQPMRKQPQQRHQRTGIKARPKTAGGAYNNNNNIINNINTQRSAPTATHSIRAAAGGGGGADRTTNQTRNRPRTAHTVKVKLGST